MGSTIRAVATTSSDRANHFRDVAHDQSAIIAKLEWQGASQEAASARAKTICDSLLKHADECDQAGRDVSSAASEVECIKSEWTRIQRMADRWGITIDVAAGSITCSPTSDPEQQAEDEHHLQTIHDALVGLLRRADSTDQHLAKAIASATSEMADGAAAEAPVAPDSEQNRNQVEAFRQMFGRDPVTESEWRDLQRPGWDQHADYSHGRRGIPGYLRGFAVPAELAESIRLVADLLEFGGVALVR